MSLWGRLVPSVLSRLIGVAAPDNSGRLRVRSSKKKCLWWMMARLPAPRPQAVSPLMMSLQFACPSLMQMIMGCRSLLAMMTMMDNLVECR